jgi:DDE superfamily endonuclease
MNITTLKEFREGVYRSFGRGADALFNLSDALLSEVQAQSLPELSLSPFFERKWSSVYAGLQDGEMDRTQLRRVIVETLLGQVPAGEIVWLGIDTTPIERAEAETSEDRGYVHLPNLPLADRAISVGWQMSNVVLLPPTPSSWTPPLETRRVPTEKSAREVAIEQLKDLRPLLTGRTVIIVVDRGYATAIRSCERAMSSAMGVWPA